MSRKGFTLIELILVIAILGILAVSALPRFINVTDDAHAASRDGVVGAVRSGIALTRAENLVAGGNGAAPTALDAAAVGACTVANPCFDTILTNGITSDWNKVAAGNYLHVGSGTSFVYDATNGTFEQP